MKFIINFAGNGTWEYIVFIDINGIGISECIGGTILKYNYGNYGRNPASMSINENFFRNSFGGFLPISAEHPEGGFVLKEAGGEFIHSIMAGEKGKLHCDQRPEPEFTTYSFTGIPNLKELRRRFKKNFPIQFRNFPGGDVSLFRVSFFINNIFAPAEAKKIDGNIEFKFIIGNDFDISDTTTRFSEERLGRLDATNQFILNCHFKVVPQGGISRIEDFLNGLGNFVYGSPPDSVTIEKNLNDLSQQAENILCDHNMSRRIFFKDIQQGIRSDGGRWGSYKWKIKASMAGVVQGRIFYTTKNRKSLLDALARSEDEQKIDEIKEFELVEPQNANFQKTIICLFFAGRRGCRNGDFCVNAHGDSQLLGPPELSWARRAQQLMLQRKKQEEPESEDFPEKADELKLAREVEKKDPVAEDYLDAEKKTSPQLIKKPIDSLLEAMDKEGLFEELKTDQQKIIARVPNKV